MKTTARPFDQYWQIASRAKPCAQCYRCGDRDIGVATSAAATLKRRHCQQPNFRDGLRRSADMGRVVCCDVAFLPFPGSKVRLPGTDDHMRLDRIPSGQRAPENLAFRQVCAPDVCQILPVFELHADRKIVVGRSLVLRGDGWQLIDFPAPCEARTGDQRKRQRPLDDTDVACGLADDLANGTLAEDFLSTPKTEQVRPTRRQLAPTLKTHKLGIEQTAHVAMRQETSDAHSRHPRATAGLYR